MSMTNRIGPRQLVAATVAGLLLGGGLYVATSPGPLLGRSSAEGDLDSVATARRSGLERDVADAQGALAHGECTAESVPPAWAPVPGRTGGSPAQAGLDARLKSAVVLVLAKGAEGTLLGTGFFVTPTRIVTNRHVAGNAIGSEALILREGGAAPARAHLLAATPAPATEDEIGPDFALLEVPADGSVQPLALTPLATQLETVVAAGYPSLALSTDAAFSDLLDGKTEKAPSMILTEGRIAAVQTTRSGLMVLPHTAQISPGNSGGPLVDGCARVVGVNTFGVSKAGNSVYYAQKTDPLLSFLAGNGVALTADTSPCAAETSGHP